VENLRRKHTPSFKAKVALEAIKEKKAAGNWPVNIRFILVRSETGRRPPPRVLLIFFPISEGARIRIRRS